MLRKNSKHKCVNACAWRELTSKPREPNGAKSHKRMSSVLHVLRSVKNEIFRKSGKFVQTAFSDKYLLLTNITISLGLSGAGDAIEQYLEIKRGVIKEYDPTRNRNMTIAGGPPGFIIHYWYKFLEKRVPGASIRIAFKKMVLDQIFCSPICISSIFVTLGLLERKKPSEVYEEISEKFYMLYVAEWVVWPPAQFINFYLIPLPYRVLFDSVISLGYDVYTSYVRYL